MADVDFRPDQAAIRGLEGDPAVQRETARAAEGLAELAAAGAPKETGRGAASIEATGSTVDQLAHDVSWDVDHYYLIFHEDGTKYVPAQRFLRHAYETYIHV